MTVQYKHLNALAEIRDYLRAANDGHIPLVLCLDFNLLARQLGASDNWCLPDVLDYAVCNRCCAAGTAAGTSHASCGGIFIGKRMTPGEEGINAARIEAQKD